MPPTRTTRRSQEPQSTKPSSVSISSHMRGWPSAASARPSPVPSQAMRVLGVRMVSGAGWVIDRAHSKRAKARQSGDRKSVVQGKSVSVRVDLGGRRIIKKKKVQMTTKEQDN